MHLFNDSILQKKKTLLTVNMLKHPKKCSFVSVLIYSVKKKTITKSDFCEWTL